MKPKKEKNFIIINILKICAIIMIIFAVFSAYSSYKHITNLILNGLEVKKQLIEVINYYITSISPYVFYGLSLWSLSHIIKQNNNKIQCNEEVVRTVPTISENKYDDIVDDLIRELA